MKKKLLIFLIILCGFTFKKAKAQMVYLPDINDVLTITDVIEKINYQLKIEQPVLSIKIQTENYMGGIYFVNIKNINQILTLKLAKQ